MKKISKNEAIRMMSEADFKVYERELSCFENYKGLVEDFYLDGDTLILYFVSEGVNLRPPIDFEAKKVGRPVIGTTKKVSLTLPDESWEKILLFRQDLGVSQSEALRTIVEEYFLDRE